MFVQNMIKLSAAVHVQRERIPILRRRYTKSSRGKRWFNTGRNSKKVTLVDHKHLDSS